VKLFQTVVKRPLVGSMAGTGRSENCRGGACHLQSESSNVSDVHCLHITYIIVIMQSRL
jgi:hypothetical protein